MCGQEVNGTLDPWDLEEALGSAIKHNYIFNEVSDMMSDKVRGNGANFSRIKLQESEDNSAGSIRKPMDGNMRTFEMDPFYKNKIEYPFEEFNPIPLDDDFLDGLYYEDSEYYDFDEYGLDDDY